MAPRSGRKMIYKERKKRRIHKIVPWIQNPLQGVDREHLVFAPRREASTLELFFDLFFVANLATFTAYHYIVDHSSLFAYIGFFTIIWATWFHTVLYDVRFENDSIYSRACKVIGMVTFVGFALVGSAFAPGTSRGKNTSFRVLCYTLVMSRVLFTVQYAVVGLFVARARRTDIFLPVALNTLTYAVAAAAYGAMTPAFAEGRPVDEANGIYSIWWIVMLLETAATIAIASWWRVLSFKKTHLAERMGLLTLIVIGEGAIGVTKTISRMMGTKGLDPEGSALVLCIVLILIGIWMLYFDNQPHRHFGTIRQQLWSALHFPIHLAIVGLVEGAQQVALARYVAGGIGSLEASLVRSCLRERLDGAALTATLSSAVRALNLDAKVESLAYVGDIERDIYHAGNTSGICSSINGGMTAADLPDALHQLYTSTVAAMYSGLGLSMPVSADALAIMFQSWKLVYRYFWAAFLLLMACFLASAVLVRTVRADVFFAVVMLGRGAAVVIATALLALSASKPLMYRILETPAILPFTVALLYLIILADRAGALAANRRNRRSGDQLTTEGDVDHDPDHDRDHGPDHERNDRLGRRRRHHQHHHRRDDSSFDPAPRPDDRRTSYEPLGALARPRFAQVSSRSSSRSQPRYRASPTRRLHAKKYSAGGSSARDVPGGSPSGY